MKARENLLEKNRVGIISDYSYVGIISGHALS